MLAMQASNEGADALGALLDAWMLAAGRGGVHHTSTSHEYDAKGGGGGTHPYEHHARARDLRARVSVAMHHAPCM